MRFMFRGFLVHGWEAAIAATGAKHPERKADALQRLIWDTIVDPMWAARNDILHRQKNHFDAIDEERMAERMQWYMRHKETVLSSYDQSLARFDEGTIHRLTRGTKREWLRQLDNARAAYVRERNKLASSRNVITRYFSQLTTPNPVD